MASLTMAHLPSMRRQHLLSEFAGLKQACPEGVFVSLMPGDPTQWSAVLFVRDGPYAPAVMRFQISFPDSYPKLPPLVTFSTDMFHPLITPLTTYMYTTDIQDNGTVSATDQERLPPGGFSLRHGFPEWFGRGRRNAAGSRRTSGEQQPGSPTSDRTSQGAWPSTSTDTPDSAPGDVPAYMQTSRRTIPPYSILKYIRSTFDNEEVLDSVPLNAAGNPGAWHAWRTHRRKSGKLNLEQSEEPRSPAKECGKDREGAKSPTKDPLSPTKGSFPPSKGPLSPSKRGPPTPARQPGEWNWDGVWEDRVKKGINSSLSEPVLFGATGGPDELIRFLAMEETDNESVKENLLRTLDSVS